MILLCLRGIIGPKMVTAGFTLFTPILFVNFQNVMVIVAIVGLINGTIETFRTAYKAAKRDDVTRH